MRVDELLLKACWRCVQIDRRRLQLERRTKLESESHCIVAGRDRPLQFVGPSGTNVEIRRGCRHASRRTAFRGTGAFEPHRSGNGTRRGRAQRIGAARLKRVTSLAINSTNRTRSPSRLSTFASTSPEMSSTVTSVKLRAINSSNNVDAPPPTSMIGASDATPVSVIQSSDCSGLGSNQLTDPRDGESTTRPSARASRRCWSMSFLDPRTAQAREIAFEMIWILDIEQALARERASELWLALQEFGNGAGQL